MKKLGWVVAFLASLYLCAPVGNGPGHLGRH